jgi:hypothetical protein
MHYTEGSVKQVNAIQRASQLILSTGGSSKRNFDSPATDAVAEPDSPAALTVQQEPSDMSHTNCLSLASSSGGYPRGTLRGILHSLLCRSGSWPSPTGSSRSLQHSVLRADEARADTSALSNSGMSAVDSVADAGRNHFHRRGSSGGDTVTGLDQPRMGSVEPRLMHVQPDKFVLEGGSADTLWERDMRTEGTAYVHWARCQFRWFLLQHEAASAIRLHASLAL